MTQTVLYAPGQTILDRCIIRGIEPAGNLYADPLPGIEPSTTVITLKLGQIGRTVFLFVTESPKAICAALDDCAVPLPDSP